MLVHTVPHVTHSISPAKTLLTSSALALAGSTIDWPSTALANPSFRGCSICSIIVSSYPLDPGLPWPSFAASHQSSCCLAPLHVKLGVQSSATRNSQSPPLSYSVLDLLFVSLSRIPASPLPLLCFFLPLTQTRPSFFFFFYHHPSDSPPSLLPSLSKACRRYSSPSSSLSLYLAAGSTSSIERKKNSSEKKVRLSRSLQTRTQHTSKIHFTKREYLKP